jgi:hypothetical protein
LLASASNYKGVAPDLIGVDQVNVQIPAGARAGCSVPVTIYTYPFLSQRATIAIHSGGGDCQDPPIQSHGEMSLIKTLLSGATSQGEIDSLTADFPSGPGITGPPGPPKDSGTTIVPNARRCAVAGYKLQSAGLIGIQPVGRPIIYVAPTDTPDGVEYDFRLPVGFIAPGDYAIKAQGGTVSFDGTVSIGSPIRVESNLAPGTQINVGSGQPFTIRWSGGDPGTIVKAYIYGGEQYAYKQADAEAGSITFQPACTGIAHPVCSIGTPPSDSAQVVVEVSPAPDKVAMFQGSGLTGKIAATWVYRYVFNNLILN